MRRPAIILSLLILLLVSFSAINAATVKLAVNEIIVQEINAASSVANLTDGNVNTAWETATDQPAQAEVCLENPAFIEGIQIYGPYQGKLSLEYWDGEGWQTFIASWFQGQTEPGWNLIDLSYDRIATTKLRLVLTNPGNLVKLGGIKEIKVLGEPVAERYQRLEPVNLTGDARTTADYPLEQLFDHNTYTGWQVTAGSPTMATGVINLGAVCRIQRIKVFGNASEDAYKFQYYQNAQWNDIVEMAVANGQAGWQSFELERYNIQSNQLRILMTGNRKLTGPREVEVWGYREHTYQLRYQQLGLDLVTLQPEQPLNYGFSVTQQPKAALLHLVTTDAATNLNWELDGKQQPELKPVLQRSGNNLYQSPISGEQLSVGEHFIRISGAAGNLVDCRLEWLDSEVLPVTPLTDRWTLTPGTGEPIIIDLGRTTQIDALNVKYLDNPAVKLEAEINKCWNPISVVSSYRTGETGGEAVYTQLGNVRRIKVTGNTNLTEVCVNGSPINDEAPQVKIINPADGACLSQGDLAALQLKGWVDQAESVITVNGLKTPLRGHGFGVPLQKLKFNTDGENQITAAAVDEQGWVGSATIKVQVGNPPTVSLNLADAITYTRTKQIEVSGAVSRSDTTITVNGKAVAASELRFATNVGLSEGFNLIRVAVADRQNPKLATVQTRRVVCCTTAPEIRLFYPGDGQSVTEETLQVAGQVDSLAPVRVSINDQIATLKGKRFSAPVLLVEGKNQISIKVQDQVGQTVATVISVKKVPAANAAELTVSEPAEGAFLNTRSIKVCGTFKQKLQNLTINGQSVAPSNNQFTAQVALDEGAGAIVIQAQTATGKNVSLTRNVIVDTQAPEAFEPTVEFIKQNNTEVRRLNFAAIDPGSGVDHYELAINDGAWQSGVVSPYQLPETLPQNTNTVQIKAVDKAGNSTSATVKVSPNNAASIESFALEAIPAIKRVVLEWEDAKTTPAFYRIKRVPSFDDGADKILEVKNLKRNRFVDREAADNIEYNYTVEAVNAQGNKIAVAAATETAGFALEPVTPKGRKVRFDDCVVELTPNAVNESLQMMASEADATLPENRFAKPVGPVYSFKLMEPGHSRDDIRGVRYARGKGPQELKRHFNQATHLKVSYAEMTLPEGISPRQLSIYWYNRENKAWERLTRVQNNLKEKTLSTELNHFSEYQVMASQYLAPNLDHYYEMGVSGYGQYFQNNQETVSTSSGNLSIVATDLNIPARAELDLLIQRIYDSSASEMDRVRRDTYGKTGCPIDTFGDGWSLNIPWIETIDSGSYLRLPEGQRVKIQFTNNIFEYHEGMHFVLQKNTDNYLLTLKHGVKYEFYLDGRVKKRYDPTGLNCLEYQYQTSKTRQLSQIVDLSSKVLGNYTRFITFKYELISGTSYEYITQISTGTSKIRTWKYGYNSAGLLSEVQEPAVENSSFIRKTKYVYTAKTLKSGNDYNSKIKTYAFNFLTGITYPTGATSTYTIEPNSWNASESISDSDGYSTLYYVYGYKVCYTKRVVGDKVVSYEYKGNSSSGRLESGNYVGAYTNMISCTTTEGDRITTEQFKQIVESSLVDGNSAGNNSKGALLVARQITSSGKEYEKVEYDYNITLRGVVAERHFRNKTAVYQIYTGYDKWGNPTYRTDTCRNLRESWTYYDHSTIKNLIDKATAQSIHPINGKTSVVTTQYIYDNTLGKPLYVKVNDGTNEVTTQYGYDSTNGNLIKTVQCLGDVDLQLTTEYNFDPKSNNTYPLNQKSLNVKDVDGKTSTIVKEYEYNPETGMKVMEKDPRGYITRYQYDALNRVTKVTLPDDDSTESNDPYREYIFHDEASDIGNNYCDYYNEKRQRTRFVFDALGRLAETIQQAQGIRYTTDIKTVYTYDTQGRVASVIDPRGVDSTGVANDFTTWYEYDGLNRVTKVIFPDDTPGTKSDNPFATLSYDDVNNTVTTTDENGGITTERNDWAGRLVEATQNCTFEGVSQIYRWQFVNDAANKKVRQIDPNGRQTDYEYDAYGRMQKQILPMALVVSDGQTQLTEASPIIKCEYDAAGNKTVEYSPNGVKTAYVYDQLGRTIKTIVYTRKGTLENKVYYDAAGNKIKTIDSNTKTWTYKYSARGDLLSQTDPLLRTTRYRYDVLGNKIAVIDPRNTAADDEDSEGRLNKNWYDANKADVDPRSNSNRTFTTWLLYDELNQLYRTVLPDSTPPSNPYVGTVDYDNSYVETEYDKVGNKKKVRDANGVTISYDYTPTKRVRQEIDALGRVQKTYTYDAKGNPITVKDIIGRVTTNKFDSLGRLRQVIDHLGNKQSLEYDAVGNKVQATDARGNTLRMNYDALGRVVNIRDPLGHLTQYQYDLNGNRVTTIAPNKLATWFAYDELNRIIERKDSLGKSTSYTYDSVGNLIGKKDPRGSNWVYQYYDNNALKRLDITGADNSSYWVQYQYDTVGNCQQISDSGNNTINYNYSSGTYQSDPLNRINNVSRSFDGKTYQTGYQYDKAGQLTKILYPEATAWLEYKYNNLNQLSEVVGFTASQNGITYNNDGSLQSLTYANGVNMTYSYEPGGRLAKMATKLGSTEILNLDYEYDPNGNITRLNDKTYAYDPNNQLIRAYNPEKTVDEQPSAAKVGVFVEDPLAQKGLDFGANQQAVLKLDYASSSVGIDLGSDSAAVKKIALVPGDEYLNHRLDANAIDVFVSADNMVYTPLARSSWSYNRTNGIVELTMKESLKVRYLKIHIKTDERDQLFQPVNQATFLNELAKTVRVYQEVSGRTEEYQYDAAGNRKVLMVTLSQTNQYNSKYYTDSDRLMSDGKYAFTYDDAGNMTEKGNKYTISGDTVTFTKSGTGVEYWQYSYDLLNRLIKVTKNGTIVSEYQYDPTGLRVVKKAKSQTTHYVFEGTEPIFEKNITTGKMKSYVYAFGKHLARVDGKIGDSSAAKYFYHTDQLGSVKAITDQNGQVVKKTDYYAFGTGFDQEGSFDETHGFTGKEYDSDIGLYYFNARWYDPELGRFISEDPAMDPNNPNLYSYCGNNPTGRIDSDGQFWHIIIGAIVGAVSAALNGGDVKDIIRGAIIGAVGAAVGYAVSGAVSIGSGTIGAIATGAVSGGITGAIMSGLTGGDMWSGFVSGFIAGGIGAGLHNFAAKGWFQEGLVSGTSSGVAAEATGGSFKDGFKSGFGNSVLNSGVTSTIDIIQMLVTGPAISKADYDKIAKIVADSKNLSSEEVIELAIKELGKTDFCTKTKKGKEVYEKLKKLYNQKRIVVKKWGLLDGNGMGHFGSNDGNIDLNAKYVTTGQLRLVMGELVHETVHYLQYIGGDPLYNLEDELEAYAVQDRLLTEVNGFPTQTFTRQEIADNYADKFRNLETLRWWTGGRWTGWGWKGQKRL